MGLASQLAAAASTAGSAMASSQKYNIPAVPPTNNLFGNNAFQQSFGQQPQTITSSTSPFSFHQTGYNPQHTSSKHPHQYYGSPKQNPMPPQGINATHNNTNIQTNSSTGTYAGVVFNKLHASVCAKGLDAFYPQDRLNDIASRAGSIDFGSLAGRWNMPIEMALELVPLALYDIVVYADDSGSMQLAENGSRIDDLREILGKVSEVATLFDDDGILIRFMNSDAVGNGIRNANDAASLLKRIKFEGTTPLGSALESRVIRPLFINNLTNLQKPILVIAITDGEPSEDSRIIRKVIVDANQAARSSRWGPGAIAFEFAQVGKDTRAQQFLATLDSDPQIGHIIDATSHYELEAEEFNRKGLTLTPSLWLVKLMVGAIDPDKDRHD